MNNNGQRYRRDRPRPGDVPVILIAGSLTRDRVSKGRSERWQIGGVVWHAATALRKLGAEVRVVTRTAPADHALGRTLQQAGVRVGVRYSRVTTVFENRYAVDDPNNRTGLSVEALAEAIEFSDIAAALPGADMVYLGPLHPHDISHAAIEAVAEERALAIALDVQGYTRSVSSGRVLAALDKRLQSLLPLCRMIKASQQEAEIITGLSNPEDAVRALADGYPGTETVITCGIRGAYAAKQKDICYHAAEPVEVDDVTGAGDIFFASYLYRRLAGITAGDALALAAAFTAKRLADPGRNVPLRPGNRFAATPLPGALAAPPGRKPDRER